MIMEATEELGSLSSPARLSNAITAGRGNRPLMAITLQSSADGVGVQWSGEEDIMRGGRSTNLHSNQHLLGSDCNVGHAQ